jgi:hypothetical protein
MAKPKPNQIPPRGLNVGQASAYWGVSPGTFKKLVSKGLAPAPLDLPGFERKIFDKVALDRAMEERGVERGYTLVAALCDEIAFWMGDESANPDSDPKRLSE